MRSRPPGWWCPVGPRLEPTDQRRGHQGHGPTGSGSTATTTARSSQWANLKDVELANRACQSLEELAAAAEQGIGRVRGESELLVGSCTRQGFPCECHPISRDSVA